MNLDNFYKVLSARIMVEVNTQRMHEKNLLLTFFKKRNFYLIYDSIVPLSVGSPIKKTFSLTEDALLMQTIVSIKKKIPMIQCKRCIIVLYSLPRQYT